VAANVTMPSDFPRHHRSTSPDRAEVLKTCGFGNDLESDNGDPLLPFGHAGPSPESEVYLLVRTYLGDDAACWDALRAEIDEGSEEGTAVKSSN
jgi:hypothetical protein